MNIFKNRIFIAIVCVILALVLGLVAMPLYNNLVTEKVDVVVATQDIHPGTKITEEMVKIVKMNVDGVPADAAHSISEVTSRNVSTSGGTRVVSLYATTEIMQDYYITARQVAERLVSPQSKMHSMSINQSVMSIPLANVSLPCTLLPNNIIQILYYDNETKEYREISQLRAVEVVCTLSEDGTEITELNQCNASGEPLKPSRIQFILNSTQSRLLASYSQSTKLAFFLVYSGDDPTQSAMLMQKNTIN